MSRVEKFCVPRHMIDGEKKKIDRMAAHIGRRGGGRVKVVGETLASNPKSNPKKETPKIERRRDDKKLDIFWWPLASGRKRY